MPEPQDKPVSAELVEQPQPPLSISHLLLWILGSAVVLWSYRWLAEPQGGGASPLLFQIDQLVRSISMGGGVAALLIYARRLVTRDAPLPRQPGHWLLVVYGLAWPAYWCAMANAYGLRDAEPLPRDWESDRQQVVVTAVFYLWWSSLHVMALLWLREARRWRVFFAVCAVMPLLHALLSCCLLADRQFATIERPFIMVRIAVTLPLLVVCVLRDCRSRVRRDWMHAAGVGFYLLGSLTSLAMYLLR
jgi:hypothetical protein